MTWLSACTHRLGFLFGNPRPQYVWDHPLPQPRLSTRVMMALHTEAFRSPNDESAFSLDEIAALAKDSKFIDADPVDRAFSETAQRLAIAPEEIMSYFGVTEFGERDGAIVVRVLDRRHPEIIPEHGWWTSKGSPVRRQAR